MICPLFCAGVTALLFGAQTTNVVAETADGEVAPQPFDSLGTTIRLKWREVAPLPVVMNGGMIGKVGRHIIYATAFGRKGPKEILAEGYTNAAWAYNLDANTWTRIADFPGVARGYGTASGVSDGRYAYVFGGQSYVAPHLFDDVYRVGRDGEEWRWERLPDMLWPTAEFGACILDGRLYVQGGAFWGKRREGERTGAYWCTQTDRVGARFQVLDLSALGAGWEELPSLPGVPRTHHTLSAAGGKLYVLGGIAIPAQEKDASRRGVFNTVDDYCFDPASGEWTRVRDMPLPLGGHAALTYRGRFILLAGGFSGRKVLDADGAIRQPYGPCQGFEDRVLVFDTQANSFSLATPMLHKLNDPRVDWVDSESFFEATGEIPNGGRIPNCQLGTVETAPAH